MSNGLFGVSLVTCEDEGCGEGWDVDAAVEKSVAVGGEGGLGSCRGVEVFGFGVEVAWCAGAAWAGQGS